jgi:CRP-like cAMP-binding protein
LNHAEGGERTPHVDGGTDRGAPAEPPRPWDEIGIRLREHLAGHLRVRHFAKGEVLWREGEAAGLFVSLRSGRVRLYRTLPTGGPVTLFIFMPGDVFGFLPFLDGGPNPASAEALEPAEADVVTRSVFQRVLVADPTLAPKLVTVLGHCLRQAFDVIQSVSTPGAHSRLASALLAMVPEGHTPGTRLRLDLPVSAHELAGALGMAPETLSRAISSLVDKKILRRVRPGRLEVLDLPGLEEAVRSGP